MPTESELKDALKSLPRETRIAILGLQSQIEAIANAHATINAQEIERLVNVAVAHELDRIRNEINLTIASLKGENRKAQAAFGELSTTVSSLREALDAQIADVKTLIYGLKEVKLNEKRWHSLLMPKCGLDGCESLSVVRIFHDDYLIYLCEKHYNEFKDAKVAQGHDVHFTKVK